MSPYLLITINLFTVATGIQGLAVSCILYSQLTHFLILFRYKFMHFLYDVTKFNFLFKDMHGFIYNVLSFGW